MTTTTLSPLTEAARAVVADVRVTGLESFTLHGREVRHSPRANRFFRGDDALPPIVNQVAQLLYDRYYVRPDEGRGAYRMVPDPLLRDAYQVSLTHANAVPFLYETGWQLVATEAEGQAVRIRSASGAERVVAVYEYDAGAGTLRVPTGSGGVQTGFFHMRGATDHPADAPETVRFYFATCRQGAEPLVASVTSRLDQAAVPFHFKVVDDPQGFTRADAAVLYVAASALPRLVEPLRGVYADAGRYLKRDAPLFTKALAPGFGYAVDPGAGESFGMHRCRLLATALWSAYDAGATEPDDVLAVVDETFARAGVPPATPHLGPACTVDVALELEPAHRAAVEALA